MGVCKRTPRLTQYRETQVIRLCLKYFRQRNHLDLFQLLQERTKLQLENPLLAELHLRLVVNGDFQGAEELLSGAAQQSLFSEYISECQYKPLWRKINPLDPDAPKPSVRGGHQMCIDVDDGIIYLFGGWDGFKDLSDLWAYRIQSAAWTCLSDDAQKYIFNNVDRMAPRLDHAINSALIQNINRYIRWADTLILKHAPMSSWIVTFGGLIL